MPGGFGIGAGVGVSGVGPAPASPNPNLLLWSEELDRATWTKVGAVVTANQGQDEAGGTTADRVALGAGGRILQVTSTAVASGGPHTSQFTPTATRAFFSVSGAFDGVTYVFSGWHEDPSAAGTEVGVIMQNTGGFIEVRLRDTGDEPTVNISQLKLETPNLTPYVKREGT